MTYPLVSIIIPCYNGEPYLDEFLDSLASQGYPLVEVVFADDGSTDRTAALFHEHAGQFPAGWRSVYLRQEHAGQAAAASMALKHITGEYLMWSDADDIMLPGSIEKKAMFLLAHPEYDMVRNDFYYYFEGRENDNLKIGYGDGRSKGEDVFRGIFDSTLPCMAGTFMMRTALIDRCYPDRCMPLSSEGQNLQLLLPAASRSRCGFIDEPLMKYRIHAGSHSNQARGIAQQYRRAEGFLKLRKELLQYCECDREYYEALAEKLFEEQKKLIAQAALAAARKQSGRNR